MSPFTAVILDSSGSFVRSGDKAAISAILAGVESELRAYWLTTSVVETDAGWLQVISDLRSDARIMITFDTAGNVMRHRVVHAPFGFIASRPLQRRLLAARTIRETELVVYHWRWRALINK
jgi:hypothetical protein